MLHSMNQPANRSREIRDWSIVLGSGAVLAALCIAVVTFLTHVVGPRLFTHYADFPQLAAMPKRQVSAKGVDGDAINLALVGSEAEVEKAFADAHWSEAVPVTRASSVAIAKSVILDRPDSAAPVSPLYLFGRLQDHAFELEEGRSARRRHHIRLWRASGVTYRGRAVWLGGASFDASAGISHRDLHPTHHIDPDIDKERDYVENVLARAGQVERAFHVTGVGVRVDAHNLEGDRFDTDGELTVVVIPTDNAMHAAPTLETDPPLVRLKTSFWERWHRRSSPATAP